MSAKQRYTICGFDYSDDNSDSLDDRLMQLITTGENFSDIVRLSDELHGKLDESTVNCYKREMLCLAMEYGTRELVEYLITSGYPVNISGSASKSPFHPLHVAVRLHREDLVELLLRHGADIHSKSKYFPDIKMSKFEYSSQKFDSSALELSIIFDLPNLMLILDNSSDRTDMIKTIIYSMSLYQLET